MEFPERSRLKKTAFHGRGTDIFWNYTVSQNEQHPGSEKIGPDYAMLISFFVYSSPRFIHPIWCTLNIFSWLIRIQAQARHCELASPSSVKDKCIQNVENTILCVNIWFGYWSYSTPLFCSPQGYLRIDRNLRLQCYIWSCLWRCAGLIVSALHSILSSSGSSPGQGSWGLFFWARHFY